MPADPPGTPGPAPGPDDDPAAWAAWLADLIVTEAEVAAVALLADAGFPTDLTRPPTAAEVASRTSYAGIEGDVAVTTAAVVAALLAARAALLDASAAVLAGAVTIADVLRRLDLTVAGVLTIPGTLDVVLDLQRTLRGLLGRLALTAARRLVTDARRARIRPTDSRLADTTGAPGPVGGVDALLDLERPDSPTGALLDTQASRLAADTVVRTVRDVRDTAHRVAAATADPAATAPGAVPGAARADAAARFVDTVITTTRTAPTPRAVTDSAHQGALAANGAGRTAAAAAYRRPSELDSAGLDSTGGGDSRGPGDGADARGGGDGGPADGIPRRPLDPNDPDRDSVRPDAGTPGGAGDGFVPEDGARFYASELLDRNTCGPCEAIDGTRYATWADALRDYPLGQFRDCEGGSRCRGTLVMVSARESPATYDRPFGA